MSDEHQRTGEALLELVEVMDRLRRECAWTAEQTHETLARYVLEETHEVLDALDSGDREALRDELGDLLMQVVFHARIAEEAGDDRFDVDDVARGITDKLRRRNPHVFGDGTARTPDEIDAAWQAVKAEEKAQKSGGREASASVHDGIPSTLPALSYADKVLKRLGDPAVSSEAGDLGTRLLALVAEARAAGVDPEEALRRTVRALPDRPPVG
ncbi:MazG family protein [Aeromicrobium sp. Leaf350]|uniref:MazG family protein n=1 Tax=Aeromicrobium sp. Leaf350 TaxID=2876565 RepID=UPI001E45836B|nr:MazG family protein [Aeromicrobium sp. Leaf350]